MHSKFVSVVVTAFVAVLLLLLVLCLPAFGQTALKDYLADPGVRDVYKECGQRNWPIVARMGTVQEKEPGIQQPVLYLFVKSNTVDLHLEYVRTPEKRYIVILFFPAAVVDKALLDFMKK